MIKYKFELRNGALLVLKQREISLDGGGWEMGHVRPGRGIEDVERWYPAIVPGSVRVDLLRAGAIEDPFIARRNEASRWVEAHDWWYRREFTLELDPELRTFLIFNGVDYECEVFVNGIRAAQHTGMFSPIIIDLTRRMARDNIVCVRVRNTKSISNRINTLKCQMGFGWDFAPAIRTMGIWDSVKIVRCRDMMLRHVDVDPEHHGGDYWSAHVLCEIDAAQRGEAEIQYIITADNFESTFRARRTELELVRPGRNHFRATIPIPKPQEWQPWDQGKQPMYRARVCVRRNGRVCDTSEARFGFRSVELIANQQNDEAFWTFLINGKRTFIRGANWVPADSFPGRVDRERCRALLTMARDAGINMLRVWGGGLREKQDFYDLCDELGLLVWQEFPLACPDRPYPRTKRFRALARQEARAIVHDLKNHPSVVMFCGGNELSHRWNRTLLDDIHRIVRLHGGGRPFKPASPTFGEGHNWLVHHARANVAEYLNDNSAFLSEFGMQAPPVRASLEKFIPADNLWPVKPFLPYVLSEYGLAHNDNIDRIGNVLSHTSEQRNARLWVYHNAQLSKIFRYADQAGYDDLDSFINASQRMQAHALQVAIEHVRRRKYQTSGVMFWQFNEPWPSICWSVVDYYLTPKLAYEKIKEVYNPLLVSLEYPLQAYQPGDNFEARVWLINDRHRGHKNVTVNITLHADGKTARNITRTVSAVEPDSVIELEPVKFEVDGQDARDVVCTVTQSNKTLSSNSYDLTLHDAGETPAVGKAMNKLFQKIFWS